MYVYQVFGLANMKALMETAEIKFITVHDVFELSPNIDPVSASPYAAVRKQIIFRNKLLVISLLLPFIKTLSSPNVIATCKLLKLLLRLSKKYFSLVTTIFDAILDLSIILMCSLVLMRVVRRTSFKAFINILSSQIWWNWSSCQTHCDSNNVTAIFSTMLDSAYTRSP